MLGTGDLSELALGWCTYGVGDQMSHYNVNAGVPKTLIQHLIRWVARSGGFGDAVGATLNAILATEISPELVPVEAGATPQSTEAKIGPYALQDFNLYYTLRYGFRPSKIAFLALHAWGDAQAGAWPAHFPDARRTPYGLAEIRKWLELFLRRFFAFSQFKRSAMPNGPKVVAGGSLSPRGDWRAPSDGNAAAWLAELARNVPTEIRRPLFLHRKKRSPLLKRPGRRTVPGFEKAPGSGVLGALMAGCFPVAPDRRACPGRFFHGWRRCSPTFPEGCSPACGSARLLSLAVRENGREVRPYWPCFSPLDCSERRHFGLVDIRHPQASFSHYFFNWNSFALMEASDAKTFGAAGPPGT